MTENFETPEASFPSLLPSSMKDVWGDFSNFQNPNINVNNSFDFPENSINNMASYTGYPASAPSYNFMMRQIRNVPSTPQQNVNNINDSMQYCSVKFHKNRTNVLVYQSSLDLRQGDFVITDADRGIDIGLVTKVGETPSSKDIKGAKFVLRRATSQEISQIPLKEQKEKNAFHICQEKVSELGLPMQITGAEYQFDGKKLTFYYSAQSFIDFRNLVRILFKNFGTRIWMIWYDGNAPVKDVLTKTEPGRK